MQIESKFKLYQSAAQDGFFHNKELWNSCMLLLINKMICILSGLQLGCSITTHLPNAVSLVKAADSVYVRLRFSSIRAESLMFYIMIDFCYTVISSNQPFFTWLQVNADFLIHVPTQDRVLQV